MKIFQTYKNNSDAILLILLSLLLISILAVAFELVKINTKVNSVSTDVKQVHQDITCAVDWHNGATGQDTCTGLSSQIDDILQKLNK